MAAPKVTLGRTLVNLPGAAASYVDTLSVSNNDIQAIMWAIGEGTPPAGFESQPQGAITTAALYIGKGSTVPAIDEVKLATLSEIQPDGSSRVMGSIAVPWGKIYSKQFIGDGSQLTGVSDIREATSGARVIRKSSVVEIDLALTDQTAGLIPANVGARQVSVIGTVVTVVTGSGGLAAFNVGILDLDPMAFAAGCSLAAASNFVTGKGGAPGDNARVFGVGMNLIITPDPGGETFSTGLIRISVFWTEDEAP